MSTTKSPRKVRTLDLTQGRDTSPLLSPSRKLEQLTLCSPRKNDLENPFQNQVKSPSKRATARGTNTPQKSRTSPRKAGQLEESPSSPCSTRRKTAKDLQNTPQKLRSSPRKKILDDSPKSLYGTPKKAATDINSTPQKLRSSARKINLDDSIRSPRKVDLEGPLKSPLLSPKKVVQTLWSSPRKVFPDSPQSLIVSPKTAAANTPRKGKSKRQLDCGEPERSVNPVVIVIEDFEGFPSQVLQDFITICGLVLAVSYILQVPFFWVVAVFLIVFLC